MQAVGLQCRWHVTASPALTDLTRRDATINFQMTVHDDSSLVEKKKSGVKFCLNSSWRYSYQWHNDQ